MASPEISVAVERAIHDALKNALQAISDQHGITVNRVQVDWIDVSSIEGFKYLVRGLNIESETRHV